MGIDLLCNMYLAGESMWCGCDWDTAFGSQGLNLNKLRAQQAEIIANATAGQEAACWREAVAWLKKVERDAMTAEREAALAVKAAFENRLVDARQHMALACAIEARYPEHRSIWETMRRSLEVPHEQPPPKGQNHPIFPLFLCLPV